MFESNSSGIQFNTNKNTREGMYENLDEIQFLKHLNWIQIQIKLQTREREISG